LCLGQIINTSFAYQGEHFGHSAVSRAMNLSQISTSRQDGASFAFNPATVNFVENARFDLSIDAMKLNVDDLRLTRSQSALSGISTDSFNAGDMDTLYNGMMSFNMRFHPRLSVGAMLYMPVGPMARISAESGNESSYLFYDDRKRVPELNAAASYALTENLNLGIGLHYSFSTEGTIQLAAGQEDADSRLIAEMTPQVRPTIGVTYQFGEVWKTQKNMPQKSWTIGAYYLHEDKNEFSFNVDIAASTRLASIPFQATSDLVAFYRPKTFGLGLSYENDSFGLSTNLEWKQWSNYKAPVIDLKGKDIEDLSSIDPDEKNVRLQDSGNFSVGFQKKNLYSLFGYDVDLLSGYRFHQQVKEKNNYTLAVVDNPTHSFSVGQLIKAIEISQGKTVNLVQYMRIHFLENQQFETRQKTQLIKTVQSGGEVIDIGASIQVNF